MNIKDYIESGILEAYALGSLPPEEAQQVEVMVAQHPELRLELDAIEAAMLQFANAHAVEPPAHMHDAIWNMLDKAPEETPATEYIAPAATPKAIPFPAAAPKKNNWARAAIWIALIGSTVANFILWNERNQTQQAMIAMQQQLNTNEAGQQQLLVQLEMYRREREMMADAGMKPVVMQTAQPGKPMAGVVYWSKEKGDAYVSLLNMPAVPAGKQYQLWVIQDGKPVSMGTISNDMSNGGMQKADMRITSGQAFAISLEKEGGSETPTEVMVVGAMG